VIWVLKASYRNDEVQLTWWHRNLHGVYLRDTNDPNFRFQLTGVEEYDETVDIGPETSKCRDNILLNISSES